MRIDNYIWFSRYIQVMNGSHFQVQDWKDKLLKFMQAGFEEVQSGELKDDGVIERRFSMLRKL